MFKFCYIEQKYDQRGWWLLISEPLELYCWHLEHNKFVPIWKNLKLPSSHKKIESLLLELKLGNMGKERASLPELAALYDDMVIQTKIKYMAEKKVKILINPNGGWMPFNEQTMKVLEVRNQENCTFPKEVAIQS